MPNTAHVFETAVLILAAFLVGCVVGYLARRLLMPKRIAPEVAEVKDATAAAGAPLVLAPTIAPVAGARPRPSPAERLAAAAGRSPGPDDLEETAFVAVADAKPGAADVTKPAEGKASALPPAGEASAALLAMMRSEDPPSDKPPATPEPAEEPRLAARSPAAAAVAPAPGPVLEPAHVAGQTMTVADTTPPSPPAAVPEPAEPEHAEPAAPADASPPPAEPEVPEPIVVPEREDESVKAADVPPIDERAHVVDRAAADVVVGRGPEVQLAVEWSPPVTSEPPPAPVAAAVEAAARPKAEDTEAAAMRAIEGGWTPPPASQPPQRPVPHPEQAGPDVDAAMANARSAVAAAKAAADVAIAGSGDETKLPEPGEPKRARSVIRFDLTGEETPENFLEGGAAAPASDDGLDFERPNVPHAFGRPEGLPEPRDGVKDQLRQIDGVTPHVEQSLNGLGIYHFDQIAAWDRKAAIWVDTHLGLRGRVVREKWVDQAIAIAQKQKRPARPLRR